MTMHMIRSSTLPDFLERSLEIRLGDMSSQVTLYLIASFPGPAQLSVTFPYCKWRKAGPGLGTRLTLYVMYTNILAGGFFIRDDLCRHYGSICRHCFASMEETVR